MMHTLRRLLPVLIAAPFWAGSLHAAVSLGFGSEYLIGRDLTDPGEENGAQLDGVVTAVTFPTGTEGAAGEHAYRLFDNAANPPPPNPLHDQAKSKLFYNGINGSITFQFDAGPQVVRSYTVASANDTPERDPLDWQLLGSNDGSTFTPIHSVVDNVWSATRHEVQLFSGLGNDTAYQYVRYQPSRSTTGAVLGTGAGALLGGDLTDPENDGLPDDDVNYNAVFSSDDEPGFGGGEFSFNVFDNQLGGGTAKWCCNDPSPGNALNGPGHQLDASFDQPYRITEFTLASSNDSPERDPRIWSIEGSNDGVNWDVIFMRAHETDSVFTARDQVVLFLAGVDFPVPQAYSNIRYSVLDSVGGANHALGEIEYFGVAVPEPGSLSFLALGLGLTALCRRRA